jgi:hypothetical protein
MKFTIKTVWLGVLLSIMLTATQTYADLGVAAFFSAKHTKEVVTKEENGREYTQVHHKIVNSSNGRVVEEYWDLPVYSSSKANPTKCPNANCQTPLDGSQQQVLDQVTNQPSLTTDIVNQLPID